MAAFQKHITLSGVLGIHARPAVKISKIAKGFVSKIELLGSVEQGWVNGKSTSAVMKLKISEGRQIAVKAEGNDAEEAVCALTTLIEGMV